MKNKAWIISFASITIAGIIGVCAVTYYIDPYMHFHKPMTDKFFYTLSNERSQNDGITKHFDYDGIITGTSMTENFRTSEFDKLYNVHSIKVPYSGGSFKEMNDNLTIALRTHPNVKVIVRALDRYNFIADKDAMREDLGDYPTYLYDNNPLNDTKYIFNRDVLYGMDATMVVQKKHNEPSGITSFDDYCNWMSAYTFGWKTVRPTPLEDTGSNNPQSLSDAEKETIRGTVEQNITSLADQYPDTEFYYFLPPYSAAYYEEQKKGGTLKKEVDIEKYAASLIIPHKNIHLFSWNRFDITDDLNNYKDSIHYADWINSWMLVQMKNNVGRLTKENYEQVFDEEFEHYNSFDYDSFSKQADYEADYYAAGLLNKEISGVQPLQIDADYLKNTAMKSSTIVSKQYKGSDGLRCKGTISRDGSSGQTPSDAAYQDDYCGTRFNIDATEYRAVTFNGKKIRDNGEPSVYIFDDQGKLLKSLELYYGDIDNDWHQYALSLEGIYGNVTVILNGGYTDNSGSNDSEYEFSNIVVY